VRSLGFLVLSLAAACGRAGFDERPQPDAAIIDGAPDAPAPPVFACGASAAVQFPFSGAVEQLSATATLHGYDALAVNASEVRGYAYDFTGTGTASSLTASRNNVLVAGGAAAAIGAFAIDDDVLVTLPYQNGDAAGTALLPLDRQLASRGAPVQHDATFGAAGSIAHTADGAVVFLSQSFADDGQPAQVTAQLISRLGAAAGAAQLPVELVPASEVPNTPTITAAGARFVVSWTSAVTSPRQVFGRVLDAQLRAFSPATQISVAPDVTPVAPRVAYARGADRYLFAWYQKVNGGDQIWGSLRNADLSPAGDPFLIATQGVFPVVAASDTDFLVVWSDGKTPPRLGAARVTKDGVATPRTITSATNGTAAGWDLTARYDQPALVWVEVNADGTEQLWIDPLCP
jgi:hypothetical protein